MSDGELAPVEKALALLNNGDLHGAGRLLEHALGTQGENADLHLALAIVDLRRARYPAAIAGCDRAIALCAERPSAYVVKGEALHVTGAYHAALASVEQAIALEPGQARPYHLRANTLLHLGKFASAVESYDAAIARKPDYLAAICNRAAALHRMLALDAALAGFDQALAMSPGLAGAHIGRGRVLREVGRFDEADASFARVQQLDSNDFAGEGPRAFLLLLQGRIDDGFEAMRKTWRRGKPPESSPSGKFDLAVRAGNLAGRTVVLRARNGLGDTLQFCRYASIVASMGARVLFVPQPTLRALTASLNDRAPVAEICTDADLINRHVDHDVDLYITPAILGLEQATAPGAVPYLFVQPDRAERWARRLAPGGFRIGICWQGEPEAGDDTGRSFHVSQFQGLANIPGVRLVSLQKGSGVGQLDSLPAGMAVQSFGDSLDAGPDAFVDTAALISACDLVITSDTAVAHLAGALGAPTWVVLKHVPDWRWMLERTDSPWYPTMRLFRQTKSGEWASVFECMAAALRERLAGAAPGREMR